MERHLEVKMERHFQAKMESQHVEGIVVDEDYMLPVTRIFDYIT